MIYDLKVSTNLITKANSITESLIFKDEFVRFVVPGLEICKGKRIPLVAPVRSVLVSAAIAQDVMETFQAYHLERGPGAASSSRALLTDVALVTAVPSTPVHKGALTRSGPRYYGYNGPPGSLGHMGHLALWGHLLILSLPSASCVGHRVFVTTITLVLLAPAHGPRSWRLPLHVPLGLMMLLVLWFSLLLLRPILSTGTAALLSWWSRICLCYMRLRGSPPVFDLVVLVLALW